MDWWMRSIGSIELALFSFDFDSESILGFGGAPTLDFAAILEVSARDRDVQPVLRHADRQRLGGTGNERGDIVMDIGGDQQPLFSVQGTRA
jgi:hypothetical protein